MVIDMEQGTPYTRVFLHWVEGSPRREINAPSKDIDLLDYGVVYKEVAGSGGIQKTIFPWHRVLEIVRDPEPARGRQLQTLS